VARFTNLDGSRPHGLATVARWAVWDRLTGKRRASPDRAPIPSVPPDLALLATPPPPGEPARVTWLGHATFLVQLDGVSLLTDPALMPSIVGGIRRNVPPGVPIERLPPIDAALVSHGHFDHLDLPTLRRLRGRASALPAPPAPRRAGVRGVPVVAGLGQERFFRRRGLVATELGWWSSTYVGGVRVTFVPAQHWSRRGLLDTNRTLWGGFVVEGSRATVYHAGDTAWFDGFAAIGARFSHLDAALLPIGAYDPPWFMGTQHLDPEQALRAFVALGARTFVAMHWGTFKLADEPLDEPPGRLEAERVRLGLPRARVRVPAVGETLVVGREADVRASARAPTGVEIRTGRG
jgi:L-ascorbate metabolism protein UlaG (beta-lactamase superfamily)